MTDEIFFDGIQYVPAVDAARQANLSRDYVARLCREGKMQGKRVGKNWYVAHSSLQSFLVTQEFVRLTRKEELARERVREYQSVRGSTQSPVKKTTVPEAAARLRETYLTPTQKNDAPLKMAHALVSHAMHTPGVSDAAFRLAPHASTLASPAMEFVHKLIALVVALMLTFGTYSLVDPHYARLAKNSIEETYLSLTKTSVEDFSGQARSVLAAVAANPTGIFDNVMGIFPKLARALNTRVNELVYGITFPDSLVYGGAHASGNPYSGSVAVQVVPYRTPSPIVSAQVPTTRPAASVPASPSRLQPLATNKTIVERVVETQRILTVGGISEDVLNSRLEQLDNKLSAQIFAASAVQSTITAQNYQVIAQTNNIDELNGVAIKNSTFTGGSVNTNSLSVSGTSQLAYASTTQLSVSDSLCINGDCRATWPFSGAGVWPFTTGLSNFGVVVQATSTPEWFQNGVFASSTSQFVYASSTQLSAASLCLTGDTCRTTWPSSGSGTWPFTTGLTNFGTSTQATTTPLWLQMGVYASSTSQFVYASSTQISATSLCLTGDTCRTTWPSSGSGTWPFTASSYNGVANQSTTTPLWLKDTMVLASTTFFTQASTTMFTNTGNTYLTNLTSSLLGTDQNGKVVATSSIGTNLLTGTVGVANGGTGASTFGQGWIYSNGATAALAASTSPTVNYLTATSTSIASLFPYASTTALSATTLCLTGDTCRTTWPTGTGGWPFTTGLTNFGTSTQATTTPLWLQMGVYASSTSQFVYASSTQISATSLCLTGDICRTSWPTGTGIAWPFTTTDTNYGVAVQSTTTPEWFKNGLMSSSTLYAVYASTTQLSAVSLCLTGDICRTSWPTGTGIAWPFTPSSYNGVANQSTTTPFWLKDTMVLASTTFFTNASTTGLTVTGNTWFPSGIWNSYGSVGIGTSTPAWNLNIASSTAPQLALSDPGGAFNHWTFRNAGGNLYIATGSPSTFATSTFTALTINNNGFVGIGSTSPQQNFSVSGNSYFGNNVGIGSSSPQAQLSISGAGSGSFDGSPSLMSLVQPNDTPWAIHFRNTTATNNGWGVFVTNTGTLSFGTSLDIQALVLSTSTLNKTRIGISDVSPDGLFEISGSSLANTDKLFMISSSDNSDGDRLTVSSVGLVGIGTTTPSWTLQVATSGAPQLALSDPSGAFDHWTQRNAGGNFYMATGSASTFATSTTATLAFSGSTGAATFGSLSTTTFSGGITGTYLSLTGANTATSTSSNGFNLSGGCFSINNTCLPSNGTTGSGASGQVTFWTGSNTLSGNNNFFYDSTLGGLGIGTTTPKWNLQLASSTAPQLALSDPGGAFNHWTLRNAGGLLYISTSSASTFATSTVAALTIDTNGNIISGLQFLGGTRGSAAAPVFSFSGDGDTGIYSSAANTLELSTNGVQRMTVNSTGQFGVGGASQTSSQFFVSTTTNRGSTLASLSSLRGTLTFDGTNTGNTGNAVQAFATTGGVSLNSGTLNGINAQAFGGATTTAGFFNAGGTVSGVVNAYGVFTGVVDGGAAVTNGYGLYIDDTQNATNAFGLYQVGANDRNYFAGNSGFGTTTPAWALQIASSTAPQLALSDPGGAFNHWTFRNAGGLLYIATSSASTFATSTTATLAFSGSTGAATFGSLSTTTFSGGITGTYLSLTGANTATSTSSNGFNLSGGCFSINNTCLPTSTVTPGGSGTELQYRNGSSFGAITTSAFSATGGWLSLGTTTANLATLTVGSSTAPQLALSDNSGGNLWTFRNFGGKFALATSTATATSSVNALTIDTNGFFGIGTSTPYASLSTFGTIAGLNINADSATATSTFAGGLNVNAGLLTHNFSTGETSVGSLIMGTESFDTDAGAVQWADLPLSSATAGTPEFYRASLNGLPMLTIYGTSQGSGVIQDVGIAIGTSTPPSAMLSIAGRGTGASSTVEIFNSASTTLARILDNGSTYFLGNVSIGTTSPVLAKSLATLGTSTAPQVLLSDNSGANLWGLRNISGNFYVASSSHTATSTTAALFLNGSTGAATFGSLSTTTFSGGITGTYLSLTGANTATSTASNGFNLSGGCFAVNNVCLPSAASQISGSGASGQVSYFNGTNSITSTNSFFFNNSLGILGVGTTTANLATLTVGSSTAPQLALSDNSGGNLWTFRNFGGKFALATSTATATSSVNALTIDTNGFFGIGTSTPYASLSTFGTIAGLNINADSATATSTFAGGLNVNAGLLTHNFSTGETSIGSLLAGTQSFDTDAGMVQWADLPLSTTSPTSTPQSYTALLNGLPMLTIYGTSVGGGAIRDTGIAIGTSTPPYAMLSIAGRSTGASSTVEIFNSASTTLARILDNGSTYFSSFFSIGTTTASSTGGLLTLGTSTAPQVLLSDNSGGLMWAFRNEGGKFALATSTHTATSTTDALRIDANGQPAFPYLVSCGGLQTSAGGVVSCTSDANLKNIVAPFNRGLSSIMDINPQTFTWKEGTSMFDDGVQYSGFVAQDVQLALPEAVNQGNAGLQVNTTTILATVVNAIKELNLKVDALASSTPSTGGGWTAVSIMSVVTDALHALGVQISQDLAQFKSVIAEKFTVGSPSKPSGITLYDEDTGAPYCLKMKSGQMVSTSGECPSAESASAGAATPQAPSPSDPPASDSTPPATDSEAPADTPPASDPAPSDTPPSAPVADAAQ